MRGDEPGALDRDIVVESILRRLAHSGSSDRPCRPSVSRSRREVLCLSLSSSPRQKLSPQDRTSADRADITCMAPPMTDDDAILLVGTRSRLGCFLARYVHM